MEYQGKITTQYTLSKKISRTENDLEFVPEAMGEAFCNNSSTVFQKNQSQNLQKNGFMIHKHHHLVDITCTFLVGMYVPYYLLENALLAKFHIFFLGASFLLSVSTMMTFISHFPFNLWLLGIYPK